MEVQNIVILTVVLAVLIGIIVLAVYNTGHFTIKSVEEETRATYGYQAIDNEGIVSHNRKTTFVVFKITFVSGRVKFDSKEFNH